MSKSYTHVFFDVDGTLCDPGDSIARSAQHALACVGIDEDDQARLRRFVGPPLGHSFRDLYNLGPSQVQLAVERYREFKVHNALDGYSAYAGVPELLRKLQQTGHTLNVVTSKLHSFAVHALDSTGLLGFFDNVFGCPLEVLVVKEEILAQAIEHSAAPPDSAVMVGDRCFDVQAAMSNNVDSIAVLYGYGSAQELSAARPTHLALTAADIATAIHVSSSERARNDGECL